MDLMAWNDLDIDITNDAMSLSRLYELTDYVTHTFQPTWYEAKEDRNENNEKVWFHGFEAVICDELWNVDLWFFNEHVIKKAEEYCDSISARVSSFPELKTRIIHLKQALIERRLYSFNKFTSMDVYNAVLEEGICDIEDFLKQHHVRLP